MRFTDPESVQYREQTTPAPRQVERAERQKTTETTSDTGNTGGETSNSYGSKQTGGKKSSGGKSAASEDEDDGAEDTVSATKMTGEPTCNPVWQERLALEVDTGYVGIDSKYLDQSCNVASFLLTHLFLYSIGRPSHQNF